MRAADFTWPEVPGSGAAPIWTGRGFRVGDREVPVLSYEVGDSGWTDELTSFHEEAAGSNHPIDLASRRHALGQLKKHAPGDAPVILEVGCSSGFLVKEIRREFPRAFVIGADYVRGPLEKLARDMPDLPLLHFDLVECPLPSASVDAVVLLNVLEHIEDDGAALRQLHRVLRPGGVAVIEVPAGPGLYGIYDRMLMHHRRYSSRGLRSAAEKTGFEILEASHLGAFVYPGFWLVKKWSRRFLHAGAVEQERVVEKNIRYTERGGWLSWLMDLELWLGERISFPAGIRCLLTCRRSG